MSPRVKSGLRGAVLGRSADGSEAEAGRHRRGAWISNSEVANRSAAEMVRSDGRLLDTRCRDAIMPLFCPTGQIDFVKSKKPMPTRARLLCMGLFSRILLVGPR